MMEPSGVRHRLTITITAELLQVLRDAAGPRRISHWLEEAAWQRIRSERDRDLAGIGSLVDADQDLADISQPPRWSGLAQ